MGHLTKELLIVSSLMVSFVAPTLATDNSETTPQPQSLAWERYAARNEELSVLLPEEPLARTVHRPRRHPFEKARSGLLYTAYGDGVVYFVLSLEKREVNESIETFAKELGNYGVGARAGVDEGEIDLDGFSGRQYRFRNSRFEGVVRFYSTKKRTYAAGALSLNVSKPAVNRFFDSVTLLKNSQARVVSAKRGSEKDLSDVTYLEPGEKPDLHIPRGTPPFTHKEVSEKTVVLAKPEPTYTEEARQHQTKGTVVLVAVFAETGRVSDIKVFQRLPHGLTENAIEAARSIRFIPAVKDGKYVSTQLQLEYSFNLY